MVVYTVATDFSNTKAYKRYNSLKCTCTAWSLEEEGVRSLDVQPVSLSLIQSLYLSTINENNRTKQ